MRSKLIRYLSKLSPKLNCQEPKLDSQLRVSANKAVAPSSDYMLVSPPACCPREKSTTRLLPEPRHAFSGQLTVSPTTSSMLASRPTAAHVAVAPVVAKLASSGAARHVEDVTRAEVAALWPDSAECTLAVRAVRHEPAEKIRPAVSAPPRTAFATLCMAQTITTNCTSLAPPLVLVRNQGKVKRLQLVRKPSSGRAAAGLASVRSPGSKRGKSKSIESAYAASHITQSDT